MKFLIGSFLMIGLASASFVCSFSSASVVILSILGALVDFSDLDTLPVGAKAKTMRIGSLSGALVQTFYNP